MNVCMYVLYTANPITLISSIYEGKDIFMMQK